MTELANIDPNVLVLENNVRADAGLTKQFIASIKENGVLVPIVAVRGDDDVLRVRAGQRRTLAAREAGLATVPVFVTDTQGNEARLVTQLSENDHRLALRAADRVLGIQALLDMGLSTTRVAKKLAVSAERVKQSKAVAASHAAMEALSTVSLAEAAAIAEFEDDEDAVHRLLQAAGRNYFEHELSRLRQRRESEAAWKAAEARYREQGFTVLDEQPDSFSTEYVPLWALLTADGQEVEERAVMTDPTQWAVEIAEVEMYTDRETGEEVDETTVDWNTEGKPQAVPAEGMRHADSIIETSAYVPREYYCLNPEAMGFTLTDRFRRMSGSIDSGPIDELAEKREQDQAEKEERRKVLALNKAGEAAMTVRRDFVRNLLSRKNPPKGAAVFVAKALTSDGYLLSNYKASEITVDLLGKDSSEISGALDTMTDARAQVITLGLVLSALEGRTPKHAWRNAAGTHFVGPREYLRFLADNGYTLSPVEHVMTGEKTADDCFKELQHG